MSRRPRNALTDIDVGRLALYERLKRAVIAGEFPGGEPLVETTLAEAYDVSRTPVREALTRLEQDGLVVRTDRGLVVRDRSREEILDIYDTRICLEAQVARIASVRRTPLDLIMLKRCIDELASVDTSDRAAMVEGNRSFHRAVWRASHNESLIDLLTRLDLHLGRYPATTLSEPGRWKTANEEHRRLVEAVEAGDADGAAAVNEAHFAAARDLRLQLWSRGID